MSTSNKIRIFAWEENFGFCSIPGPQAFDTRGVFCSQQYLNDISDVRDTRDIKNEQGGMKYIQLSSAWC